MEMNSYEKKIDELFSLYSQNSFGSISKRELDIFLFQVFRDLGKIKGDDSWSIANELKISKSKAQTLLYESSIRYGKNVNEKIGDALNSPPRIQDGGCVWLMVDDKYARETMRAFLMEQKIVSDLSFASEIVKMPAEGYWILQQQYNKENLPKLKKDEFVNALIEISKGCTGKFLSEIVGAEATGGIKRIFNLMTNKIKCKKNS